ncbi:MAG: hypothetical protein PHV34_03105 [Verrucomicrobiae bacterium]|nr:hypothetical protein [Verrucomicrobiae bacterium]
MLVRGWRRERATAAHRRLLEIAFLVGFQIIFDLATPQVSLIAHASGMLLGFLIASVLRHRGIPHQPIHLCPEAAAGQGRKEGK